MILDVDVGMWKFFLALLEGADPRRGDRERHNRNQYTKDSDLDRDSISGRCLYRHTSMSWAIAQ